MKWGEMKASSRKRMKKSCAAIQLPSQFLYIHPCHFFGQNDSLSFCSSVKAFRQEQVTIMPKRLIAMKLFMKERFLILKILDISHKIAEFIEEVNHHATIASRQGSCPFSGNSHGFHGMKRCFQRIGVHSKECPNDTSGSTSHCSNLAHHGMSFMNISHSFAIRDEVYGSSYNYDTGKLLSQFLSLFLTS